MSEYTAGEGKAKGAREDKAEEAARLGVTGWKGEDGGARWSTRGNREGRI